MAELIDKGALVALIEKDKKTAGETTCAQGYWCGLADAQDHALELPTTTEAEIKERAYDEAIEKFLEHGCVCIEWNNGLSKEKLVDDVLRQVMGQVIIVLEKLKQSS